jgi:hypothetical protein
MLIKNVLNFWMDSRFKAAPIAGNIRYDSGAMLVFDFFNFFYSIFSAQSVLHAFFANIMPL